MGDDSKIEWCDHTFNPWIGCTKLSPACDHCYAEGWAKRTGNADLWSGGRRRTSETYWRQPVKWNRDAAKTGVRRRVFCASLADVFDNQASAVWREDMWRLIDATPELTWMLLTKRPQNIAKMLPPGWTAKGWPNVWLGTTVENQDEANRRLPHLLAVPAERRFVSAEPLLGPVDFGVWFSPRAKLDLIIVGGESGRGARPMHPQWVRGIRDQCNSAGVAFFFKQWGEWGVDRLRAGGDLGGDMRAGRVRHVCAARENDGHFRSGDVHMRRVGKARAGRMLDGREHNDMPASAKSA